MALSWAFFNRWGRSPKPRCKVVAQTLMVGNSGVAIFSFQWTIANYATIQAVANLASFDGIEDGSLVGDLVDPFPIFFHCLFLAFIFTILMLGTITHIRGCCLLGLI